MCEVVYLASDKPLPLIEYDQDRPAFWVGELGSFSENDIGAKKQFLLPYVYYIGSHKCCGCGFQKRRQRHSRNLFRRIRNLFKRGKEKRSYLGESDLALNADVDLTYRQLVSYLQEAKTQGARLELFSCYDGFQEEEHIRREVIRTVDIESSGFTFAWETHYELIE
jgi:hypothetical protein